MADYASFGEQASATTTFKTCVGLTGGTSKRFRLFELDIGIGGTPADNAVYWDVSRSTAAGTSTAYTPSPLDPADAAAVVVAGVNHTGEPTVTASTSMLQIPANQRASYRWTAAPGKEIVVPASANAGLAVRAKSAGYAGVFSATVQHNE